MIGNNIAYWRSTLNAGKGISQAHLARHVRVSRSFITKLEKGKAQPGAQLMFHISQYFGQTIDSVFQDHGEKIKTSNLCPKTIPARQSEKKIFTPASAKPLCNSPATLPAGPAVIGLVMDKSLVNPTAKVVASLSRNQAKGKL